MDYETNAWDKCKCKPGYGGATCDGPEPGILCPSGYENYEEINVAARSWKWVLLGSCLSVDHLIPMRANFFGSDLGQHADNYYTWVIIKNAQRSTENLYEYVAVHRQKPINYCHMTSFQIKEDCGECWYQTRESRKTSENSGDYSGTCNGRNKETLIANHWSSSNSLQRKLAKSASEEHFGISRILVRRCQHVSTANATKTCRTFKKQKRDGGSTSPITLASPCYSVHDVNFLRAYLEGSAFMPKYPTSGAIVLLPGSVSNSLDYVISRQSDDDYCKMVLMRLTRNAVTNTCVVEFPSSGYTKSPFGSSSKCTTPDDIRAQWNSMLSGGYGVESIDYEICTTPGA